MSDQDEKKNQPISIAEGKEYVNRTFRAAIAAEAERLKDVIDEEVYTSLKSKGWFTEDDSK